MPNYTNSVWSEATPAPPYEPLVEERHGRRGGRRRRHHRDHRGAAAGARGAKRRGRRGASHRQRGDGKDHRPPDGGAGRPYHTLMSRFGVDGARLAAAGQRDAIDRIAAFADECAIECDFRRVSGFMFAETEAEYAALEREAAAARKLGVKAALVDGAPLPFPDRGRAALRQPGDDTSAPLSAGPRARRASRCGGQIFEDTQVVAIDGGRAVPRVSATAACHGARRDRRRPRPDREPRPAAREAGGLPLVRRRHRSGRRRRASVTRCTGTWPTRTTTFACRRSAGAAICWSAARTTRSARATTRRRRSSAWRPTCASRFGRDVAATDYRWSGQIVTSADGLPYVGRNSLSHDVFVATGYGGQRHHAGDAGGDGPRRRDRRTRQPARRAAGRDAHQAVRVGGRRAVARTSTIPSTCWPIGCPAASARARRRWRRSRRGRGGCWRSASERLAVYRNGNGQLERAVAGLHAPRLPGPLEHHREELGLPLPRQPLRSARARAQRAGGGGAGGEADSRRDERSEDAVLYDLHEHPATD